MQTLQAIEGRDLRWVRPKRTKLAFQLRDEEAVLATLAWARGSRAQGAWARGQYDFRREGWLRQRILVHDAAAGDSGEPVATMASRGGALSLPDGRALLWKKPARWTNERVWVDSDATELVRFRPRRGETLVTIQPGASSLPDLPLLLLLGQYLLVLTQQDAVAATSAAMVPIIAGS
jgi:hypothetical protein